MTDAAGFDPDANLTGTRFRDIPLHEFERPARWAAEQGIPYVDTTPSLAAVVARGEHPYFVDDVHWNALGHATAADAIAAKLAATRLFPFRPETTASP